MDNKGLMTMMVMVTYKYLSMEVSFKHVGRAGNGFADALANQGVGRSSNLTAIIL